MDDKLVVDGFIFRSKREFEKAKKEHETIKELRQKIDLNNQDNMIELYNKLVSKRYFQTPVGLSFLYELRAFLKEGNDNVGVAYIPVASSGGVKSRSEQSRQYMELQKQYDKQSMIKNRLILAIVSMVIVIVGMIFIMATNENVGYFNAEEKVLDKYSAWEERLQKWEEELTIREDKLLELEKEYYK
ncbi:MAG: hypothetical protein NC393_04645 [Clostridium sp.]|nr:hypothetical protein [Clostridium sp.]MCM1171400.1 hypothetical protein [Clostridium sp.]MCM1208170.1 hypothetical protein [Ruminococcus sp.]